MTDLPRPKRDPLYDTVRGLSLLVVVFGHWLIGSLVFTNTQTGRPALAEGAVMAAYPWAAPVTWLVSVLGLFFFIGGRLSAGSWARSDGQGGWAWFGRRLIRLGWPLVMAIWPVAVIALLLWLAGVPRADLALAGRLLVLPLWFLGVYAILTAATPGLVWLDRHWSWGAPIAMVVVVALIDAWRFGPFEAPSWIGWVALLPGWTLTYQLGLGWARRTFSHRLRVGLLVGGAASTVLCWTVLGYPVLMLAGGAEVARPTIHPPTLVMMTLMTTAIGAFLTWEEPLRRRVGPLDQAVITPSPSMNRPQPPPMPRPTSAASAVVHPPDSLPVSGHPTDSRMPALPDITPPTNAAANAAAAPSSSRLLPAKLKPSRLTRLTNRVNNSAVQVLALHQAAALAPVLVVAVLAPGLAMPGLTAVPDGPIWLLARFAWLVVFTVLLFGIISLTHLFDRRTKQNRRQAHSSTT